MARRSLPMDHLPGVRQDHAVPSPVDPQDLVTKGLLDRHQGLQAYPRLRDGLDGLADLLDPHAGVHQSSSSVSTAMLPVIESANSGSAGIPSVETNLVWILRVWR